MAIDKVVAPLLRVPVFVGLKPLQIIEIAHQAERIKFQRGGIIIEAGKPGDGAYLIVSGDAEVRPELGSLAQPQPVEPGSLVGELAMLVDHVYGATVIARGRMHCLKITRAAMHEQMRTDPTLAEHFVRLINDRLTQVAAEMRNIDRKLAVREGTAADVSTTGLQAAASIALPYPTATGTRG